MDEHICQGCGARNAAEAEVCDWCGRSFVQRRRSLSVRWWQLFGSILFGLVVAAVVGLAILNASRPEPRPRQAASGPVATDTPAEAARQPGSDATPATDPIRTPTSRPASPTPAPAPTATPPPPRYARVANTGGLGVTMRRDPGPQGQSVGAVSENALLKLVGPEETVQARLWRLCEYEGRGIQGWVPAEYLQQTDQLPTPSRQ